MTSFKLKSSAEVRKELGEYMLHGSVPVYTIKQLPENIDLGWVLQTIEKKIPKVFFHNVDSIYIGQFEEFEKKDINAFYSDGAIFVTNNQDDDEDLLDDIIHETAHAVEQLFPEYIYDHYLEQEFFSKREQLFRRLKAKGWNVNIKFFLEAEYSQEFGRFLYMEVGYPLLASLTYDLFNSPYAITSLQEYWANGFEGYFIGDTQRIQNLSPHIYNKITTLTQKYNK